MSKRIIEKIVGIAKKLPDRFDISYHPCTITGRDIHLSGLDPTDIDNDDTEYMIQMPTYQLVNHKRRMVRAFNSNGMDGAKAYINKVIQLD